MENNKMRNAALWYANRDWPVLPLYGIRNGKCECGDKNCKSPGKHPRIYGGLKDATTDKKIIEHWFTKWPNANIGIRTGRPSGFIIIDVDPIHGGEESIDDLEAEYGKLPDTVETLTGGNGRHIFLKHPDYYVKGLVGFMPGVDLRADGNYVIVPPSLHISGNRYEFEVSSHPKDVEIATAPSWFIELIKKDNDNKESKSVNNLSNIEVIPEGRRDSTLTSIAGTMRRRGIDFGEMLPALLEINKRRCKPPLPDSQVEKITKSVCKYRPQDKLIASVPEEGQDFIPIVQLSTVKPEKVEFLWKPYFPLGKLTLIDGDPGLGKSWLTLAISTSISKGNGLPNVPRFEPANVLLLSAEDGLEDTIKPRLESLEADCTKIFAAKEVFTLDQRGLDLIEGEIIKYSPKAVFIDPIVAYFGAEVDLHRANETRAIMAQLAEVADRNHCAIVGVRHLTKGGRNKPIYRGLGSIDLTAACRSVVLIGADPHNDFNRAMIHIKSNLAPLGKTIGFKIDKGKFFWTGDSNLTANQILAPENEEDSSAFAEAVDFLKEMLSNGRVSHKDVIKQAKENGISEVTLRRAKKDLNIKSEKEKFAGGKWYWILPTN